MNRAAVCVVYGYRVGCWMKPINTDALGWIVSRMRCKNSSLL